LSRPLSRPRTRAFVTDETQAQVDANCPGPKNKGITLLHFTGFQGASTLTVLP
jgi:hypothetical protein